MVIPYEVYYLNQRDKEKKRGFVDGVGRKRQRKRGFAHSLKALNALAFNLYHYTNTLKLLNSLVKNYQGYFFNQRDKEGKSFFVDGVGRKRRRKRGFAQLSMSSKCLGIQPLSLV